MEITINVPKNTYSVPTEVRQEVVQTICDAFLYCNGGTFFPRCHGRCGRDRYVTRYSFGGVYFTKDTEDKYGHKSYDIRGCEMQTAFKILIEAGYHMFRLYGSGGYKLSKKPHLDYDDGCEVYEFTDFID